MIERSRSLFNGSTAKSLNHSIPIDPDATHPHLDHDVLVTRRIPERKPGVQAGIVLIFARVSEYLRSDMDRHGITAVIGPSCIFSTLHEALAAVYGGSPALTQAHNVDA